eukprot:TRINITY_DN7772_c0_g1_i11.p1 TRINITY_DN7772_c0_g1~~TRINITY_DN7772_c0_g1_i11.p1  ORF type:complete len:117 (-),score=37.50 TRINITY_DN7772_c0_g1_i11:110-460(-)
MENFTKKTAERLNIYEGVRRSEELPFRNNEEGAESSNAVSFDDKVMFTEKLKKLSLPALAEFVDLIRGMSLRAVKDVNMKKLQIRVDDLDKDSFMKLTEFLDHRLSSEAEMAKKLP